MWAIRGFICSSRGEITKKTHDHSPVGEREDRGELTEIEAMRHARRNEIFRDVGSGERVPEDPAFIEILTFPMPDDGALLLCSDGLTDLITQRRDSRRRGALCAGLRSGDCGPDRCGQCGGRQGQHHCGGGRRRRIINRSSRKRRLRPRWFARHAESLVAADLIYRRGAGFRGRAFLASFWRRGSA